jgi:glyceraldehyde-3-phosphate dehydrogenase (NADP+)
MREFELQIGGQAADGQRTEIRSPYDGRVVGSVGFADAGQVAAAIAATCEAAPAMAALPRHSRIAILHDMAHALLRRKLEIAQVIRDEAGKPIRYAEGEAARAAMTFSAAAEACKAMGGEHVTVDATEAGEGRHGVLRRFPVGPVTGISPFNFPLNLTAHKLAPAIAAGCPMVLKPASQTPMSALLLGQIAREAGLPEGALNVVPASRAAADQLVQDDQLKLLTFTGSAEVGWDMKRRAGRKKVVLELGGNAAAIVGPDADLDQVVPRLVLGAFAYAGQICISVQRIFVLEPLAGEFIARFVEATEVQAKVGDPADPEVMVGPMIDSGNLERTVAWIEEAREAGAQVLCGGELRGSCVSPAVITGADPALKVCCEEAFAPLVVIEPVLDWQQAIERTNDSRFGLQCAVFTNDLKALWQCFEGIEVGGVIHNDSSLFRVDHMPYGGVKDSGLGREGPRYAMEEMTEPRLLVLRP